VALALAVGIGIMGLIWTVANEREFLPAEQRNYALGCTGQWLVWGTLLFAYIGAFAFFSFPNFLDTEGNLIIVQGAHTLHDAYWVMLLMGMLTAIHFAFLMRREAIGNVRKFALWFFILGIGLQVTAAITLTPNRGLGLGDNYANYTFWGGVALEVLAVVATLYGSFVTGSISWGIGTLVLTGVGVTGIAVDLVASNPLPDVLVAFTILGGLGAVFYAIYGKDAPAPNVARLQARTSTLPRTTAEPGLPE
jgi:hypothetical protein